MHPIDKVLPGVSYHEYRFTIHPFGSGKSGGHKRDQEESEVNKDFLKR